MPRSREALLHAMSPRKAEDRLTEIFAVVLDACDELAKSLFAEVELPVGERFQVFTQVAVTKANKPDMLVHSLDRGGTVVSRLWSEHKIDSGFGLLQRERYLESLRALPGDGELIFIVKDAPTARESGEWRGFTWQEIAELAEGVGLAWGGRDWRREALAPTAPAKWRLLWELLWYLEEEEGLAVAQALDQDRLLAFKLMEETAAAVAALLERASQSAPGLKPSGSVGEEPPTLWQHFEPPPGSWLDRFPEHEGFAEL